MIEEQEFERQNSLNFSVIKYKKTNESRLH